MAQVEVCFSPQLFSLYDVKSANVVVVDVLRATSAICAAFENGVESIIPVPDVYLALEYRSQGYLAAAERNGKVVPGFDFGNSPFAFMQENLKGEKIVLTTTNGTKAIEIAKKAKAVLIGSFLNLGALVKHLTGQNEDVVVLCAGWKDRYCIEDALFAGALAQGLVDNGFDVNCDSANIMMKSWAQAKDDLNEYLMDCSHRKRLGGMDLTKDVEFCLTVNQSTKIPVLKDDALVLL